MNRLFAIVTMLACSGCSLIFDFTECASHADCASLDGAHVCVSQKCAPVECVVASDCGSGICESNVCVALDSGAPDMSESPDVADVSDVGDADLPDISDAATACTRNSQCPGTENICLSGECVTAITSDCRRVFYPADDPEDYVILGSIVSTSAPFDSIGVPLEQSIELAVRDFNAAQGLPGGRRIVWVSCDDRGDATRATAAASHLVDNLGVQAIVGPLFSTPYIAVVEDVAVPNNVFTISPTASAPSITSLVDNDLAWRVIASDVFQGRAIVDRVAALAPTNVSVFAKDDAYGTELSGEMAAGLMAGVPGTLYASTYADPASLGFDQTQIIQEFASVIASSYSASPDPDLVLFIGTTEALQLAAAYVDFLITQRGVLPQDLPRLLFSHGAVAGLPDLVTGSGGSLQPLVEGVAPSIFDAANFLEYTLRFRLQFNDEDPITISTLAYDATLVTLFAMSAVPAGEALTGPAIATGVTRLIDATGVPISFGDSGFVSQGRNALVAGNNIDLRGVSGNLNFDLATGDVRANVIGWETELQGMNYQLKAVREYVLDAAPAVSGTWTDL